MLSGATALLAGEGTMNNMKPNLGLLITYLLSAFIVSGCGGTKVLKEPQPTQTTQPLAATYDRRVTATLDWVIVRDGPGTWARNADWDEYLLRVANRSDQSIRVTQLTVIDSLNTRIERQSGRKELVRNSRKTARRYRKSGVRIKAGRSAGTLLVAGAVVTAAGVSAANAVAYGAIWSGGGSGGSAGTAAASLLLLGPVLVVGGIVRGVNNSKVNDQIERRQTLVPLEIPASRELGLNVFFPIAPSPRMVELIYTDATGEHSLVIDTSTALDGLHLEEPTE